MQINTNDFNFLVGDFTVLEQIDRQPAYPMFDQRSVDFLAALSQVLMKLPNIRQYKDILSYAYWIRKTSLIQARQQQNDLEKRLGRGVALHVAPSNVAVNFAVSMTSSLLAGNATMIRVSNKEFEQVTMICQAIRTLLNGDYAYMKNRLCIFRYAHSEVLTGWLTDKCDLRIIWGGNRAIHEIRKAPLPPRAIEMTFADRHSLALIQAEAYLQGDAKEIAKGFYTDTYYSDQNACSSPRLVVWLGKKEVQEKARELFWKELDVLAKSDYDMKPIQAVDKYNSFCNLAMSRKGVHLVKSDNLLMRVQVDALTPDLMDYKNGGGYFFEYCADNINSVVPVLNKQCQTIAYYGIEKQEILDLVFTQGVRGVDRIVPLGQTMGLEFVWDGYKMIEAMTRVVYC